MRAIAIVSLILFCSSAYAQEAKAPVKEAKVAKVSTTTPASRPAVAPVDPGVKQPTGTNTAVEAGRDLVSALKTHRWWFAASGGIFLALFLCGVFGLWIRIGTFWAWIAVGILSLAAGIFAAFDKTGFSWGTLFQYLTAGPTIAWARDFVKDVILKRDPANAPADQKPT
jgi:hypothetical protein